LNVGWEYFFSCPNNRFASRFLKIPKICHIHHKTNLSSCLCIFLPPFSSSHSVVRLVGDFCIVPKSTYSCSSSCSIFIHHTPLPSLSSQATTHTRSMFTGTLLFGNIIFSNNGFFWDITPYGSRKNRRFGGT
jgi:hypothetical protein